MPNTPVPFSLADPRYQGLREILCRLYYNEERIVAVLNDAGLDPSMFNLHGDARVIWGDVLRVAYNALQLDILLDHVEKRKDAAAWKVRIAELRQPKALVERDKAPSAAPGAKEQALADELLLGETSTLLDVAFLRRGVTKAVAVARVVVGWPSGQQGTGTGFLFRGPDPNEQPRLLTNHHVLVENGQLAVSAKAQLNYERDVTGADRPVDTLILDVAAARTNPQHDWAVVPVRGNVPAQYEPIVLAKPTLPIEEGTRVYIIQHPRGNYKQIGLHRNLVTKVTDDVIQYLTDTEPGSSGSPVFNDRWELVALHHASTRVSDAQTGPAQSATAGDRTGWILPYRNEGIRIERVIEGVL